MIRWVLPLAACLALAGCGAEPPDAAAVQDERIVLDTSPPPNQHLVLSLPESSEPTIVDPTVDPTVPTDTQLSMTMPLWESLPAPEGDGFRHLEWIHLMPPEFNVMMAMSNLDDAPVVEKLDGERVRIPGYVLPLDLDMDRVYRFLIVPYVGACIHVPPPPSNQIIYAQSEDGMESAQLWDAVYIYGTLNTQLTGTEWGNSSYVLDVDRWEPYVW